METEPMKCLVCLSLLKIGESSGRERGNISNADKAPETESLQNQLRVVFMLRKLLKLPTDICIKFLQCYGNPCSWVYCCDSCSVFVEKARNIFDKITMLQSQFSQLQELFQTSIALSVKSQGNIHFFGSRKGARDIVRSYVTSAYYNCTPISLVEQKKIAEEELNQVHTLDLKAARVGNILPTSSKKSTYCKLQNMQPWVQNYNFDGVNDCLSEDPLSLNTGNDQSDHDSSSDDNDEEKSRPPSAEDNISIKEEPYGSENEEYSPFTEQEEDVLDKEIICTICNETFANFVSWKAHLINHSRTKPYECGCGLSYVDLKYLEKHISTEGHSRVTSCKCMKCEIKFPHISDLKEHVNTHEIQTFSCPLCLKFFSNLNALILHTEAHEPVNEKPIQVRNKVSAEQMSEGTFICAICEKGFTGELSLKAHVKNHSADRKWACELCEKRFKRSGHLLRHLETHDSFRCDICKRFFTAADIAEHKKTHHNM